MVNTTLPTNIQPGTTGGVAANANEVHRHINRFSRDTGWRDVSSLIINSWGGVIRVRRMDSTVYWRIANIAGNGSSTKVIGTVAGFMPSGSTTFPLRPLAGSGETLVWGRIDGTGFYIPNTASTAQGYENHFAWHCRDEAFPDLDNLPGIPTT